MVTDMDEFISDWAASVGEMQQLEAAARATRLGPVGGLSRLLRQQRNGLERAARKLRETRHMPPDDQSGGGCGGGCGGGGGGSCSWLARWGVVRRCRGLIHVNREFPRSPRAPVAPGQDWRDLERQPFLRRPTLVHAVVDSGATWVKFFDLGDAALEKRILRAARVHDGDSEDDDDHDDDENLDFACDIRELVASARWNHCLHVRVVLSRVTQAGASPAVNDLLARLVGAASTPGCGSVELTFTCSDSSFLQGPAPPPAEILAALLDRDPLVNEDRPAPMTHSINLDPSILLGMVSDLTHGPVGSQPESQRRIIAAAQQNSLKRRRDGHVENVSATWPDFLSPTLKGRELVCTRWAAKYFHTVVTSIATHSEAARAKLVLPLPEHANGPFPSVASSQLQRWSGFPIPPDLRLPVRVVDDIDLPRVAALVSAGSLPPMALAVAADLAPLNRSVYMYGWAHGLTTLSSHRGVVRQVQLSVARHWTPESPWPPDVLASRSCGFLAHRDKPTDWRDYLGGAQVPEELSLWTSDWTTWGRGINSYGVADTKAWDGVSHETAQKYGRGTSRSAVKQSSHETNSCLQTSAP